MYNHESNDWDGDITLGTAIPNTGQTKVAIPDLEMLHKTDIRLALLKVSLNTDSNSDGRNDDNSDGAGPRQKRQSRVLDQVKTSRSAIKLVRKQIFSNIDQRLACEAWHSFTDELDTNQLPPCPCNIEQMNSDLDRYTKEKPIQFFLSKHFFKKEKAHSCYRQSNVGYVY